MDRKRVIRISYSGLQMLLKGSKIPYKSNLPKDVEIIKVFIDNESNLKDMIKVIIQSKEFEEINEGSLIPEFDLKISQI